MLYPLSYEGGAEGVKAGLGTVRVAGALLEFFLYGGT
jgi:hypothetical protein